MSHGCSPSTCLERRVFRSLASRRRHMSRQCSLQLLQQLSSTAMRSSAGRTFCRRRCFGWKSFNRVHLEHSCCLLFGWICRTVLKICAFSPTGCRIWRVAEDVSLTIWLLRVMELVYARAHQSDSMLDNPRVRRILAQEDQERGMGEMGSSNDQELVW